MLYSPAWNDRIYEGVSLRGFIAFLETQNPDETYNYTSQYECALGRYMASLGCVGHDRYVELGARGMGGLTWERAAWLRDIVNPPQGVISTFGAALERARAALSEIGRAYG